MKPLFLLAALLVSSAVLGQSAQKLEAGAFAQKLAATPQAQVLDVRTKGEFAANHLSNALQADYNQPAEFAERTKFLDKTKPVFVYCLAGGRSAKAAEMLAAQGFTQVYDLAGGMNAWRNAKQPYVQSGAKKSPGMSEVDFQRSITQEKKLVLVDFGAKWCPPCKKMVPELDSLAKAQAKHLVVLPIDVDEHQALAQAKKVEALPVLQLYKNGKMVWEHRGYLPPDQLSAQIAKFR
ncbi:MAG: thioredoxin domain-containing protein [Bernardetiaceae bacterium]|jgi:thioredoxin|nr:thioredoxin domain-containing protein [Bernardetiaceae bacterium]